ncbi:hypothetical protein CCR94_10505 [Rhodoblastus sphagnicola]|uniref:Uncharacterized protein n=1 Tax=Rhodoblastus sphagnicola TaxID=333368 RepID=A0A2S6N8V1_9HYPH|nr:hypothetical protein [Rhodoblastus sphagnicola]PPQ31021.1 hypothetical protein CCR94_10505 [Rhodoblastus sphagnicola]
MAIHACIFSADKATNRRDTADLGHAGAPLGGDVVARQANGAAELAGRHVHQHQIERPLAEQVLVDCGRPTRQDQLITATGANARAFDFDLAAVKATLPLCYAPAMTGPVVATTMARTAESDRVFFHHSRESGQPGRQAQGLEAGADSSFAASSTRADGPTAGDVVGFFMALLSSEDSTPRAYWLKVSNAALPFQQ